MHWKWRVVWDPSFWHGGVDDVDEVQSCLFCCRPWNLDAVVGVSCCDDGNGASFEQAFR